MRIPGKPGIAALSVLLSVTVLTGCESTRERLLAQGYPAPYASGFDDGCGSGRQAAGALGEFRKNVPAYLDDRKYATGWDDGFRQCQASTTSDFQRHVGIDSQADRDWQHSKDQAWSKAIRH
ncbi:hypothetical protein [Pseudomonas viridiflava]|uniref:hypothetical protein n=1 Tax=Pseudomonas viridiflava TaxID=33069 RepID=UPI000F04EEA5|nr:hypothetical protein [Pseudomonas viridiflava]